MILITADTHNNIDFRKLDNKSIKKDFDKLPNFLIVAGDFGLPWSNDPLNSQDVYLKRWYEEKPYTILVVPGNHENYDRIELMPEVEICGAKARKYGENIYFIEKNEIMTVEDKTFYCFGGADSTDKEQRITGISWWSQEQATYADYINMATRLETVKKVDFVITHTCPVKITELLVREDRINDSTSKLLNYLDSNLEYKHWFFGHFHVDKQAIFNKYTCLYNKVHEV